MNEKVRKKLNKDEDDEERERERGREDNSF